MPPSTTAISDLFPFYRAVQELGVSRAIFRELLIKFKVHPIVEHRRRQYFSRQQLDDIRSRLH